MHRNHLHSLENLSLRPLALPGESFRLAVALPWRHVIKPILDDGLLDKLPPGFPRRTGKGQDTSQHAEEPAPIHAARRHAVTFSRANMRMSLAVVSGMTTSALSQR